MKKLLLCSCFFSVLLSYASTEGNYDFSTSDTLSHPVKEQPVLLEKKVSHSFLNKLVEKFPSSTEELATDKIASPKFSWQFIKENYKASDTVLSQQDAAAEIFKKIRKKGAWVKHLLNEHTVALPVGLKDTLGGVIYAIGIVKAKINPQYTELTVFAKVTIPQTDENGKPLELFFGADDVKLSHQGGIVGDAKLVLLGDVPIPFNGGNWLVTFKGGLDMKTGDVAEKTYATISCDGIESLSLNGSVEFSRKYILPVGQNGKVIQNPEARVHADFNVTVENWNDLLVDVSLQPFTRAQKRNNKDYSGNFLFFVNNAVLDFSDLRNSPSISFPEYYTENGLLMQSPKTWRGVYIKTVEVRLPKEFNTKESISHNRRVSFEAHHMIIDAYGLSGTFSAENLFQLDEGRTNEQKAWAYSLEHLQVSLAANHFVGAEFNGRIILPVSKKTNANGKVGLRYAGLITQEEYMLKVATDSTINFSLWQAKGQLSPNSSIELRVVDGEFRPKAVLNGQLSISANQKETSETEGDDDSMVAFKGIKFQSLVLQTESPVLSVGYLGYNGKVKFGNFPVSISNIELTAQDNRASLWFDLKLNLMDGAGFGAETRLGILAVNEQRDSKQQWRFDGLDIETISVAADMGAFAFNGTLTIMNNDPEYGDGFSAELNASFEGMAAVEVSAKGIFGRVDGFRYWYFDASVDNILPPGSVGFILPKGFAGGAYYRMKRKGFGSQFSPSGLSYVPDPDMGLGVKAMIMCSIGTSGAVDAGAGFEILFNRHGGVSRLGFFGQAKFMGELPFGDKINALMGKVKKNAGALKSYMGSGNSGISKLAKPFLKKSETSFPDISTHMGIEAKMGIQYDFTNKTLHGELDIYVNVGGGAIQGRSSGGRAGWAVYHASPDLWYLHMGTPTNRLGLKMGIGSFSVSTGGYFMIGDKIPASPPPPPIVAEILGTDVQKLDYMRDLNALGEGSGFAFGADLSVNTGVINFLIIYAQFQAGIGFDMMLKDYGDAACANRGGEQIGIDGWYANGQSYAYLQGELGLNINLFFVDKKIPIIKGSSAVLLQAMGPNPIWMRGYVAGSYNVLGGLVKGSFRLKVVIGEKCELMNASPLGGLKIIADVTPEEGSEKVDVFAAPQATFTMKINEPIVIPENDGDKTYKIILEKFRILHKGEEIPGELKWNSNHDRATFVSTDLLPQNESLKVEVQVSFREYVNGTYQTVMVDGKKAVETEVRKFTTGEAPNHIPLSNIVYAYPVVNQNYFLEKEYGKGYVQLNRGQDYLFDMEGWKTYVKLEDETGKQTTVAFHYKTGENRVYYNLPNLKNGLKYKLAIVSSTEKESTTGNEVTYETREIGNGNTAQIRQKQAETIIKEGAIARLTYDFSTSKYNTFKQKVRAIKTKTHNWGKISTDVIYLTNRISSEEPFGLAELVGNKYTENKPLVRVEAALTDDYYLKDMKPPLYGKYPLGGMFRLEYRGEDKYGIPPKKAVPIMMSYLKSTQSQEDYAWRLLNFPYFYNLPYVYKRDWKDLQSQILNAYLDGKIARNNPAYDFLGENFHFMRYGKYTIDMQYVLPGGKLGTSYHYDFKNENKFR